MIGPGANQIVSGKVWSLVLVGFMKFGQFLLVTDVRKAYMHGTSSKAEYAVYFNFKQKYEYTCFLETVTVYVASIVTPPGHPNSVSLFL